MPDLGVCLAQVGPEEPGNKDKVVMEWSNNQLLRLEESLAAMEQQIGSTHPHVSALSLAGLSSLSAASRTLSGGLLAKDACYPKQEAHIGS